MINVDGCQSVVTETPSGYLAIVLVGIFKEGRDFCNKDINYGAFEKANEDFLYQISNIDLFSTTCNTMFSSFFAIIFVRVGRRWGQYSWLIKITMVR